ELCLHVFKRREIPGFLRFQVGSVDAPVLITTNVLNVQNMLIVLSPEIEMYTSVFVPGNGLIVPPVDGADSDIQNVVDWCQVSHFCAIRRDLGTGLNWIAK